MGKKISSVLMVFLLALNLGCKVKAQEPTVRNVGEVLKEVELKDMLSFEGACSLEKKTEEIEEPVNFRADFDLKRSKDGKNISVNVKPEIKMSKKALEEKVKDEKNKEEALKAYKEFLRNFGKKPVNFEFRGKTIYINLDGVKSPILYFLKNMLNNDDEKNGDENNKFFSGITKFFEKVKYIKIEQKDKKDEEESDTPDAEITDTLKDLKNEKNDLKAFLMDLARTIPNHEFKHVKLDNKKISFDGTNKELEEELELVKKSLSASNSKEADELLNSKYLKESPFKEFKGEVHFKLEKEEDRVFLSLSGIDKEDAEKLNLKMMMDGIERKDFIEIKEDDSVLSASEFIEVIFGGLFSSSMGAGN